jgi:ribosomal protein S18 acetylase RimI-like enzyme
MDPRIKNLSAKDWRDYKSIRLEALKNEPLAFGASYREEKNLSKTDWQEKLVSKKVYGLYARDQLIGINAIRYENGEYFKHIANLTGLYIKPEYRKRGFGEKLMSHILNELKNSPKILKVRFSVGVTQKTAISLYRKFGFKKIGHSHKEMRVGNKFYDEIQMEMILNKKVT